MTPQKKRLYIAIVICGVVVMIIDRFAVGYAPEVAQAVTTTKTPAVGAGLDAADAAIIDSIPELPFPRLVEATGTEEFVDFFTPPSLRHRSAASAQDGEASDIKNGTKKPSDKTDYLTFESTHTLDAVMLSPKFHVAIINGSWVQLGQTWDGCKLSELTDNIARFECTDGSATLRVISVSSLLQN